ncbi:MAG TPA: phosphate acyltransferase PlsX [Bryobacterales bacterium]|nr:phosphate acyltransferase PlsX [Bryobacterales bacterium]
MLKIAIDAMGADQAPGVEVEGAVLAAREYGIGIILVGRENALRDELSKHDAAKLPIEIAHASEVISMSDVAGKALRAKDSSIRVAARLVRDGLAQGVISAGHTGAAMAISKVVLGVLPGVHRPAIAQVFPTLEGTLAVLLDVGANVDCDADMLADFAVMGAVYSRVVCHRENPRVGILSIGEEEHKGNELTRQATPLLKKLPINFIGNVEGQDLYSGHADVIVCDGFTGNVALKVSEGLVKAIKSMLRGSLESTLTRQLGYALSRGAYEDFRKRVDYSEYGGAPLLGVKGVSIICHGRSNAHAIKNAVRVARESYEGGVNKEIETTLLAGLAVPAAESLG